MNIIFNFISTKINSLNANSSVSENHGLLGHDEVSKEKALAAIDILVTYKSNVHDFTQEIVDFWELPRLIMQRYQFEDPQQLNDLLESV